MASYRLSSQIIGRSNGRTATSAAAYRAAQIIICERTGKMHDYTQKSGVLYTEIIAPEDAPEWVHDRETLWNNVEAVERRKDAQLAREIQLSLPHELDDDTRRILVQHFARDAFVSRGMVADVAIHAPNDLRHGGEGLNHHAHIMLTMRTLDVDGFGKKERSWNATQVLETWRERWAAYQNEALEKAGIKDRVDHRTLEAQGINREPEIKLGYVASDMERKGKQSALGDEIREIWARNAERALQEDKQRALDLQIAQARLEQANEQQAEYDALYDLQQQRIQEERDGYQKQVDTLSQQLEGKGRFLLLWEKLRGRVAWKAEQELEANRQALQQAKEHERILNVSRQIQEQRAQEDKSRLQAEFEQTQFPSMQPPIEPVIAPQAPIPISMYDEGAGWRRNQGEKKSSLKPIDSGLGKEYAEVFRKAREEPEIDLTQSFDEGRGFNKLDRDYD